MLINLQPKKTKFKRLHRGRVKRQTNRKTNSNLFYGTWGLQVLRSIKLTGKQIEAVRRVLLRQYKHKKKYIWIRGLTDLPITKKPKDLRMGKGKGPVSFWVQRIPAGKIFIEIHKLTPFISKFALMSAAKKLPTPLRIITKCRSRWLLPTKDRDTIA